MADRFRWSIRKITNDYKGRIDAIPSEKQIDGPAGHEWDVTKPPGVMDISDVGVALRLAPSETLAIITDLFKIGRVDMNKLKTAVFLTPKGI
jgi:hypothetical protein